MNLLKKARSLLSDQLAIAHRDGLPLPDGLGFELDQPTPIPTPTPTPTPTATQSDRPKTKEELLDELRKMVDKGGKKMLQRWN
jgi:hypothetical protein